MGSAAIGRVPRARRRSPLVAHQAVVPMFAAVDALGVDGVLQAVGSYVPIEVFRCSCVAIGWRELWSPQDVFKCRFALDLSYRLIRARNVVGIAQRLPPTCESIDIISRNHKINFEDPVFWDNGVVVQGMWAIPGVRSVAEPMTISMRSLSLQFANCTIEVCAQ